MKHLSSTFILMIFSFSVLFGSGNLLKDSLHNTLSAEIKSIIKEIGLENKDLNTLDISFLVNNKNEIVLFDAKGGDDKIRDILIRELNYKKISTQVTKNIRYHLVIQIESQAFVGV